MMFSEGEDIFFSKFPIKNDSMILSPDVREGISRTLAPPSPVLGFFVSQFRLSIIQVLRS